jgi:glycosyltransferase involved in cell wall biosynthesis
MSTPSKDYAVSLSVVIPVYNEEDNLSLLRDEIMPILEGLDRSFEIVFVDDGSRDKSGAILKTFAEDDARVRVVRFARNYGQQMANTAGLRHSRGRNVIIMDADMQTPADNIPAFLDKIKEGFDIVYGVREKVRVPLYRRLGTRMANFLICRLTGFQIPDSASGFLALDRELVEHVNRYNERSRYLSGLFAWLAYGRYAAIDVTRRPRMHGESKYNLVGLAQLVINFITVFSAGPVLIAGVAGSVLLAVAGLVSLLCLQAVLMNDMATAETTLCAAVLLAVGATELIFMGLLGTYVGRIYANARQNPSYVITDMYEHGGEASS